MKKNKGPATFGVELQASDVQRFHRFFHNVLVYQPSPTPSGTLIARPLLTASSTGTTR